ncbi:hypothetical protein DRJ17_02885 [Candidatus Woesearchaeota archaeon]|nr:MAG: hypothetical protein DRJ17_02885 [Candidatus Woesearchaeota archaeon]
MIANGSGSVDERFNTKSELWQGCDGCHWVVAQAEICTGYIDEDCNGDVDCDDPDCTGDVACTVICQDSDGDG